MEQTRKTCLYTQLDGGIHRIELMDNSMEAANEYLSTFDKIIGDATERGDDLIRILIVISAPQMPSLQYLASRGKKVLSKYPNRPPFRNVYVFGQGFMANLLQMFVKMIVQRGRDNMNFFQREKMDEAMAWLLADD